jgi:hypothetical protein
VSVTRPTSTPADAGWYPDPEDDRRQRYWDGNAWTDQRRGDGPPAPPAAETGTTTVREPRASEPVRVVKGGNNPAAAAIALGLAAFLVALVPLVGALGFLFGLIAVVLGIAGRSKHKRGTAVGGKGAATTGIVFGLLAMILGVVGLFVVNDVLNQFGDQILEFGDEVTEIEQDLNDQVGG